MQTNLTKAREATADARRGLDDMWKHGMDEDDISVLKSALESVVEALEALTGDDRFEERKG